MKHSNIRILVLVLLFWLGGCASKPTAPAEPAWVHQPSRTMDSGYIVYVGVGEDASLERAIFQAESVAIGDLANECSLIPKGARIEDRFIQSTPRGTLVYAKIGITFEECEEARKAVQPEDIVKFANVSMTEQMKKYQELYYEKDESADTTKVAQGEDNTLPEAPAPVVIHDSRDLFIARQRIVYWKQDVILAPPGTYVRTAPAYTVFVSRLTPVTTQVHQFEQANPTVRAAPMTWSHVRSASPAAYRYAAPATQNFRQGNHPVQPQFRPKHMKRRKKNWQR